MQIFATITLFVLLTFTSAPILLTFGSDRINFDRLSTGNKFDFRRLLLPRNLQDPWCQLDGDTRNEKSLQTPPTPTLPTRSPLTGQEREQNSNSAESLSSGEVGDLPIIAPFDEWTKEQLLRKQSLKDLSLKSGQKSAHTTPEQQESKSVSNGNSIGVNGVKNGAPKEQIVEKLDNGKVDVKVASDDEDLSESGTSQVRVYGSERYPSNDWSLFLEANVLDNRHEQHFDVTERLYMKFVKVELASHHGSEHYCTLSLVRILGVSLADEYEAEEALTANNLKIEIENENKQQNLERERLNLGNGKGEIEEGKSEDTQQQGELNSGQIDDKISTEQPSSLVNQVRDAVMNVTKGVLSKAANLIGSKGENETSGKTGHSHEKNVHNYSVAQNGTDCDAHNHSDPLYAFFNKLSTSNWRQPNSTCPICVARTNLGRCSVHYGDLRKLCGVDKMEMGMCSALSKHVSDTCPHNPAPFDKRHDHGADANDNANADFPRTWHSVDYKRRMRIRRRLAGSLPVLEGAHVEGHDERQQKDLGTEANLNVKKPEPIIVTTPGPTENGIIEKESNGAATKKEPQVPARSTQSENSAVPSANSDAKSDANYQNQQPPLPGSHTSQRESVFVKLNARIKTLEQNLTLSGQYLSELSRKYVNHTEEVRRQYNKTSRIVEDLAQGQKGLRANHDALKLEVSELKVQFLNMSSELAKVQVTLEALLQAKEFDSVEELQIYIASACLVQCCVTLIIVFFCCKGQSANNLRLAIRQELRDLNLAATANQTEQDTPIQTRDVRRHSFELQKCSTSLTQFQNWSDSEPEDQCFINNRSLNNATSKLSDHTNTTIHSVCPQTFGTDIHHGCGCNGIKGTHGKRRQKRNRHRNSQMIAEQPLKIERQPPNTTDPDEQTNASTSNCQDSNLDKTLTVCQNQSQSCQNGSMDSGRCSSPTPTPSELSSEFDLINGQINAPSTQLCGPYDLALCQNDTQISASKEHKSPSWLKVKGTQYRHADSGRGVVRRKFVGNSDCQGSTCFNRFGGLEVDKTPRKT